MIRIDSHQHYWYFNKQDYGWMGDDMSIIQRNFLADDLLPELQSMAFDGSIAVQARQSLEETYWLLELADKYPHIKGVVGWLDLQSESALGQLIGFAAHAKAVGVRHVIHDEEDVNFMLRPDFIRGVKLLEQFQLTYDILIFPTHLKNSIRFVEQFSANQKFVIDHIAKPKIKEGLLSPWSDDIRELAKHQNVYCKLSGLVTEADWQQWTEEDFRRYLDVVFDTFGKDRVLIGSDWPVCLLAGKYSEVMQIVINYIADFSEKEKDMILGGNALKAYPRLQI